jgi:hypothetical protein
MGCGGNLSVKPKWAEVSDYLLLHSRAARYNIASGSGMKIIIADAGSGFFGFRKPCPTYTGVLFQYFCLELIFTNQPIV